MCSASTGLTALGWAGAGYLMAGLHRHLAGASLGIPALGQLALGQEALLRSAVPALITPFVESPAVLECPPEMAHGLLVAGLTGADEVREGDGGLGQGLAEKARDPLAELRWRRPCSGRGLLDLQPVLVGP